MTGLAHGFGTLPHQAEIWFQHSVHRLWILVWHVGENEKSDVLSQCRLPIVVCESLTASCMVVPFL